MHSSKVTAWCVMNSKTLVRPYWFEDGEGRTVTVIQENYCTVICKCYGSVSRCQRIVIIWQGIMQNGATPHIAYIALELLAQKSGDRVISWRMGIPWAAHSADLNLPFSFEVTQKISKKATRQHFRIQSHLLPDLSQQSLQTCARELLENLQSDWMFEPSPSSYWTSYECLKTLKTWGENRNEHQRKNSLRFASW